MKIMMMLCIFFCRLCPSKGREIFSRAQANRSVVRDSPIDQTVSTGGRGG